MREVAELQEEGVADAVAIGFVRLCEFFALLALVKNLSALQLQNIAFLWIVPTPIHFLTSHQHQLVLCQKLEISDYDFLGLPQRPRRSQQLREGYLQFSIDFLTVIAQQNRPDSSLILLDKHQHLSLFHSLEVYPLADSNHI